MSEESKVTRAKERLTEKYEGRIARMKERASEAAGVTSTMVGAAVGGGVHGTARHYLHDKKIAGRLTADKAVSAVVVAAPFIVPGAKNRRMMVGPAAGVVGAEVSQLVQESLAAAAKQQPAQPAQQAQVRAQFVPGAGAPHAALPQGNVLPFAVQHAPAPAAVRRA